MFTIEKLVYIRHRNIRRKLSIILELNCVIFWCIFFEVIFYVHICIEMGSYYKYSYVACAFHLPVYHEYLYIHIYIIISHSLIIFHYIFTAILIKVILHRWVFTSFTFFSLLQTMFWILSSNVHLWISFSCWFKGHACLSGFWYICQIPVQKYCADYIPTGSKWVFQHSVWLFNFNVPSDGQSRTSPYFVFYIVY